MSTWAKPWKPSCSRVRSCGRAPRRCLLQGSGQNPALSASRLPLTAEHLHQGLVKLLKLIQKWQFGFFTCSEINPECRHQRFFSSKGVTCRSWLLRLFNSYCKLLFLSFLSIFLGPALRQLLRSFLSCYFISYVGQRRCKVPLLGFITLKL